MLYFKKKIDFCKHLNVFQTLTKMDNIPAHKKQKLHDLVFKIIYNLDTKYFNEAMDILKYEINEEMIYESDIKNLLQSFISGQITYQKKIDFLKNKYRYLSQNTHTSDGSNLKN